MSTRARGSPAATMALARGRAANPMLASRNACTHDRMKPYQAMVFCEAKVTTEKALQLVQSCALPEPSTQRQARQSQCFNELIDSIIRPL